MPVIVARKWSEVLQTG